MKMELLTPGLHLGGELKQGLEQKGNRRGTQFPGLCGGFQDQVLPVTSWNFGLVIDMDRYESLFTHAFFCLPHLFI